MLKVVLAGLVIMKAITLKEAERIDKKLGNKPVPHTIKDTVKAILEAKGGE